MVFIHHVFSSHFLENGHLDGPQAHVSPTSRNIIVCVPLPTYKKFAVHTMPMIRDAGQADLCLHNVSTVSMFHRVPAHTPISCVPGLPYACIHTDIWHDLIVSIFFK